MNLKTGDDTIDIIEFDRCRYTSSSNVGKSYDTYELYVSNNNHLCFNSYDNSYAIT